MSECVPVVTITKVSSESFCCHTSNQSDLIWHSQVALPFLLVNLCGRYSSGNLPSISNISIAFFKRLISKPRFLHSLNVFLNSDVTIKVYFAITNYFIKSRNISSELEYDVTFPFFISSMPAL